MCTASTAKRKRRQARNGYKHLGPLKRPIFHKPSEAKARRRLRQVIEKQKQMASRKGQSGKGKK